MEINRYFITYGEILYSRESGSAKSKHFSLLNFINLKRML